jgi:hypothetical protein
MRIEDGCPFKETSSTIYAGNLDEINGSCNFESWHQQFQVDNQDGP